MFSFFLVRPESGGGERAARTGICYGGKAEKQKQNNERAPPLIVTELMTVLHARTERGLESVPPMTTLRIIKARFGLLNVYNNQTFEQGEEIWGTRGRAEAGGSRHDGAAAGVIIMMKMMIIRRVE